MPSIPSRSAPLLSDAIANGDPCFAQPRSTWPRRAAWAALAALLMLGLTAPAQAGPNSSVALATLAVQSDPGRAPAQAATTLWLCHLSGQDTQLVCIAEPAGPGEQEDAAAADLAPVSRTTVHGTRFPLDPARVYAVDLLAPATEADWLEQLARATVCYRSPGCQVVLTGLGDLLQPARGRLVRSN